MYLKRTLFVILMVLAFAGYAEAQGTIYNLSPPAPNAQLRVCPSPDNGYPCPVTAAIFSDVGLTQSIAQPVQLGPSGFATFYIASGTYVIQLSGPGYGAGNRQTVTIGGGGGGFPVTSAAAVGTGGSISVTPGTNGSIAGVQVAAPPMAFYLSPQCPTGNTAICFYTPADTQIFQNATNNCSWTAGQSTAGCTTTIATAASIGMRVFGYNTCGAGIQASLTNASTFAMTTGTVLTVSAQTGTGVTFTGGTNAFSVGSNGCLILGHTDDTGAAAVDTAMQAAPQCPKLFLAAAYYLFTVPHWFTQPISCKSLPTIGGQSQGDVLFAGGMEIEGRGRGNTVLGMTPGFPESGSCTNGPHANACWVRTLMGEWRDFQLTGFNNSQGVSATTLVNFQGPGALQNFTCTNWGNGQANTIGFYVMGWDRWDSVDNSGCGGIAQEAAPGLGGNDLIQWVCMHCVYENSITQWVLIGTGGGGGDFSCWDCYFYEGLGSVGKIIDNRGGRMLLSRTTINFILNATASNGYNANTTAGNILWAHDLTFAGAGTNSADIVCVVTCTNYLQNTIFNATGGTIFDSVSTSQTIDEGGNTNIQTGTGTTITGQIVSEANSTNLTPVTAGKFALGAGFGSTAAVTALTGGDAPISFTITNSGTGQAASPTIVYTFPIKYPVAPYSCAATQLGGTNPTLTYTPGTPTQTSVTFTTVGTPTVSDTEIMQITCVTP
jgi:hypothetical protein